MTYQECNERLKLCLRAKLALENLQSRIDEVWIDDGVWLPHLEAATAYTEELVKHYSKLLVRTVEASVKSEQ